MSIPVCCYHNPYFRDQCSKGNRCKYRHLTQSEYVAFVETNLKSKSTQSNEYHGFKTAMKKFNQRQYGESAKILKSLLNDDPYNPRYNSWYARTLEKSNAFKSAEFFYRKAIAAQPQNATLHGRYASLLHFKLHRLSEAKHHYETALSLRDNINAVHCHYAKLLCDLEDNSPDILEAARYHFKRCLEIFERDEECHFYFGQLLYKTGDFIGAEHHIKRALHLQNKAYIWHYFYYALVCIELEKYGEAKQHLQICLDLQYVCKSIMWDKIYLEYGLLLIFRFDSKDTGMKYMNKIKLLPHQVKLVRLLSEIDASSIHSNVGLYASWRNILKSSKVVENLEENLESVKSEEAARVSHAHEVRSISRTPETPLVSDSNSSEMTAFDDEIDDIISSIMSSPEMFLPEIQFTECSVRNEFYRFLKNVGLLNYFKQFADAKVDDIRLIQHIDDMFLSAKIGMNEHEILIWRHYTENEWKKECHYLSETWKNTDRFSYSLFYPVLVENGLMTIESFFYYFKDANDLLYLVNNYAPHAQCLWQLFQHMS